MFTFLFYLRKYRQSIGDMDPLNSSRLKMPFALTSTAPKQHLPLGQDKFKRVVLTRDEQNQYIGMAKAMLNEVLSNARQDRETSNRLYRSWKQLGSHAGFNQSIDNSNDLRYRLQGTVRASLNNLMGIMYADSTAQVLERRQLLYYDSLDAQTLYVLKERSAENMHEHLSIRWQAINLCSNSPIYRRDMCFLEYTGVVTDIDGMSVGFSIKQSIARKECVSLKDSHGLSRLEFTEITLLRPTLDAGHTDIIMDGVVRHPENLPIWLVSSFLSGMASSLSKLPIVVQERLLARLPVISDWQFVPLSCRKTCHVCASKFRLLSKKVNCRSCGQVTCKSCIVTSTVDQTNKFCNKCILMVSTHAEPIDRPSEYGLAANGTMSPLNRSHRHQSSDISILSSFKHDKSRAAKIPEMRVDMKLLENPTTNRNNCSMSSTASETSFDSSSSYFMDHRNSTNLFYHSLDEDVMETVDTTQMTRCARRGIPPSVVTNDRPMPTVESVKDAIAQQQYLLKEMLTQAQAYQQQKTQV